MFSQKSKISDFGFIAEGNSLFQIYPRTYGIILLLLIMLSGSLLIAGLFMPVLTFKEMAWFKTTFSVLSGIQNLWQEKQPFLALIIVLFSVIFPVIKLFALAWLWLAKLSSKRRMVIIERLELLGKWSMLDVFVVAVTVVAVKLGFLIKARPRAGIYVFASSIILTMFIMMWLSKLALKASRRQDQ
ncbi:MAG: paraquat-inducible protein A [Candidatus Omnitrophica bacterium]|nr:paraquat-inducible protein A [Candidatus Omnitrophota bacterium]